MGIFSSFVPLPSSPPVVKLASVSDLTYVLSKVEKGQLSQPQLDNAWSRVKHHLQDRGSEAARIGGIKTVKEILRVADEQWISEQKLSETLKMIIDGERTVGVREGLTEVLKQLEN